MQAEKTQTLDPEKTIGFKSEMMEFPITHKDTIIYALAIGFNEDPLNKDHYRFTYELNDDFSVFPTYVSVIPINGLADLLSSCPGIPDFNLMGLLHGEEWVDMLKPLPTSGCLLYQAEIADLEDKGKGTVVCIQVRIYNKADNSLLAIVTSNLFVRGLKGNGVKSRGPLKALIPKAPKAEPFKSITLKTYPNQAFYYRIGGNDANPLHVDPDMAAMGGFEKPILHGLCTYGMTAKAVYELFCDGDKDLISSFKARMTSYVFPGESLNFRFWKGEGNNLLVSVTNVKRGTEVMIGEVTLRKTKF